MDGRLRVISVEPARAAVIKDIDCGLESLQAEVGGLIECLYPFEDQVAIICNDEGKIRGLPLNRALRTDDGEMYDIIAGPFMVVGISGEEFCSLSPEQQEHYLAMYGVPERFEVRDGQIVVESMQRAMDIRAFKEQLSHDLEERFSATGISVVVEGRNVEKPNYIYDGLVVRPSGASVGVSVDLATAYNKYRRNDDYEGTVRDVFQTIRDGIEHGPVVAVDQIGDYAWAKDHLAVEVVNRDNNMVLLTKVPHEDIVDLAVIYRLHIQDREDSSATTIVTNEMISAWGITPGQLYADALVSAEKQYPASIRDLGVVLSEILGIAPAEDAMGIYVCTAEGLTVGGAGVIAYPDFAEKASDIIRGDFYLLPSSRHEVLLVPAESMDPRALGEMVRSVNGSDAIRPEDILSNQVYYYNSMTKTLGIAESRDRERNKAITLPSTETSKRRAR